MDYEDRGLSATPGSRSELAEADRSAISEEELRTLVHEILERGRTQRSIAAESGVPQGLLSQWLKGKLPYSSHGIVEKLTGMLLQ